MRRCTVVSTCIHAVDDGPLKALFIDIQAKCSMGLGQLSLLMMKYELVSVKAADRSMVRNFFSLSLHLD